MRRKRILIATLLALATAGGAYYFLIDTYHFAIVKEGVLYRDGFQGMRRFRTGYRSHPFKSVINLQSAGDIAGKYKEQEAAERKFCEERGIRYYRIPMKQGTPPSPEQAARMLSLMDDSANHPVFMHDSQGIIREGMMVALFQMERMGYSPERALKEARWFGHDESPVMVKFINSYRLTK